MKKKDMTEQMYGVSELPPTSKPPQPRGEGSSSKSSHSTGLTPDQRKDKLKKKKKQQHHQDPKLVQDSSKVQRSSSDSGDITATKKKVSVRPYTSSYQAAPSESATSLTQLSKVSDATISATSLSTSNASHSASVSATLPSPTGTVKEKKVKKAKRRKSGSGSYMQESKPVPHTHVLSEWREPLDAPVPNKSRPGALKLPVAGGDPDQGPGRSDVLDTGDVLDAGDVPDTGDVQHMLHELLNPPHVSVVTPIPTPSKGQPFIFPALSSVSRYIYSSMNYDHLISTA